MKLTDEQAKAADAMLDFLTNPFNVKPYFVLTGAAGTGKTTMLKEVLKQLPFPNPYIAKSAAAVAHAAKNVLMQSLGHGLEYYTVAQWLGLNMNYTEDGKVIFTPSRRSNPRLKYQNLAILDEASMINDQLYHQITNMVNQHNIKLIVLGDVFQLPPVEQEHDSLFFENADAELTQSMRFKGPISVIADVYRQSIADINDGYTGSPFILNEKTERQDSWDETLKTGYFFLNNLNEVLDIAAADIKEHIDDINHARLLAFKNANVAYLNHEIRKRLYGSDTAQFERGEIVISNGGYSQRKKQIIYNGEMLKVINFKEIAGPNDVPCLAVNLEGVISNGSIPVVKNTPEAIAAYEEGLNKRKRLALRDPSQWKHYYDYIAQYAWFDYGYAVNSHKAQGQTLNTVYVMEGEIMSVKPLTLKQKFQSLYVSTTRPTNKLYIYNKNY